MQIEINCEKYELLSGYQKTDHLRRAFNELSKNIFKLSFEDWYQSGYWNDKYIPYTLFDGDKAVANVSTNIINFKMFGEQKRTIQIGTVMTDEAYRGQSLCKFLMHRIINEWSKKCDFIYLFSNNSALDLYPKFGFDYVREYEYFKSITGNINNRNIEKLDMNIQLNKDRLYDYAKNSNVFGKVSMHENADLVMFYCTSSLKENVYYIKSFDTIAVAIYEKNKIHLWDIFCSKEVGLEEIVCSFSNSETNEVVLGFTPNDTSAYQAREILGDDKLFIQHGKTRLFDENKIMFPLLSHA